MTFRSPAVLGALLVAGLQVIGSPQNADPAFEAASIKPAGDDTSNGYRTLGQQFQMGGTTLAMIQQAYSGQYRYDEIIGGPAWIRTDRYHVTAKSAAPGAPMLRMLRTLLGQRFALRAHEERRELQVYEAMLSRRDGQIGPQLRASAKTDCAKARQDGAPCSLSNQPYGTIIATGWALGGLFGFLDRDLGRRVIDKTGLTGNYDFDLRWETDTQQAPSSTLPALPSPFARPSVPAPSVFTALQEQFGIKLEPAKAMLPVLVIDSIERPTEN